MARVFDSSQSFSGKWQRQGDQKLKFQAPTKSIDFLSVWFKGLFKRSTKIWTFSLYKSSICSCSAVKLFGFRMGSKIQTLRPDFGTFENWVTTCSVFSRIWIFGFRVLYWGFTVTDFIVYWLQRDIAASQGIETIINSVNKHIVSTTDLSLTY